MSASALEQTRSPGRRPDPQAAGIQVLTELYRQQRERSAGNAYLDEHARPSAMASQVRAFNAYLPYLPVRGKVLDWGCNHAPDSCLLRASCGGRFEVHGCDFSAPGSFAAFHEYAELEYRRLTDPLVLPYGDCTFDAAIGSGVLEHTALDYEALKNVYRVLKPDGVFIITYLPNWLSCEEWIGRVVRRRHFHRRLYGLGEIKQLLKRTGFMPLFAGYQSFFWEKRLSALGLGSLAPVLNRLLPVGLSCSVLWAGARKMRVI